MAEVARELLVKLGIQFDNKSAANAEAKISHIKYAAEGLARSFKNIDRAGTAGISKLSGSLDYAAKPATSFLDKLKSVKGALVAVGAAFAVSKIANFIQHTADSADELKAQAERIGTTTKALQGLQFAAELSDTSAEALGSGLQFLARSAYAAKSGSKEAQDAFKKLGVSVTDSNGKLRTTDQIMLDVADGLQKIESPAEKTALTMKVMGRSAGELVPFLAKGSAELLAFRLELEELGGSFSTEFIDLADDWNDNGKRMGAVLRGIGAAMANGILPPLNRLVNRFLEFWKFSGGIIRSGLEKFFAGIGNTLEIIGKLLEAFLYPAITLFASLVDWVGSFDSGLQIIIATLGAVAAVMFGLVAPWVLIAAVIALVAEDIYTYFVGGDSVTGKVVESFKAMGREISAFFSNTLDWIVEKFNALGGIAKGLLTTAANFLGGDVSQTLTQQVGSTVAPSGTSGGSVTNAQSQTTITVNASPGMDESALADKVAKKIEEHETARNQEAFGALVPAAM